MSTRISYRWRQGETLRYRMITQGTTALSGGPGEMANKNFEQTISQVFRMVVENTDVDGMTTLRQSIESVRMEMGSSMGKITYDSADTSGNPANPMMAGIFSTMIGEPFSLGLLPTGAVQRVEGFGGLLERVSQNVPQDSAGKAMLNAFKETFSDDSWRNMFGRTFTQFPDRPLNLEETWNTEITIRLPMMGALATSIAATLKAVEDNAGRQIARIATRLTIGLNPRGSAGGDSSVFGVQIGESTGEGEILFDITRGRLLLSTTHAAMRLTVSGTGPDGTATSMKPNVKTTMTMELVRS
jgi:uncharacterized protein DUF6263